MYKCYIGFIIAAVFLAIGIPLYLFAYSVGYFLGPHEPSIMFRTEYVAIGVLATGALLLLITFLRWINEDDSSAARFEPLAIRETD